MAKIQNGVDGVETLTFIAVYIPIAICQWWPKGVAYTTHLIAVKC